jgi:hypothetical protein
VLPALRSLGTDDTPAKHGSSSALDQRKQIVSPKTTVVLSSALDGDHHDALNMQLGRVRLSGVCTPDLMEAVQETVDCS